MTKKAIEKNIWWGNIELPEDHAVQLVIGPADIWIGRSKFEWRVSYEIKESYNDEEARVFVPKPLPAGNGPNAIISRFGVSETSPNLAVTPALADRPVVIRPEKPLYILPDQKVSLYLSTPLWMRIETGKSAVPLMDFPVERPSDTWFGATTMAGELCYASRTAGRLKVEEVVFRAHRAVTAVKLHNFSKQSILLERLKLPVQNLTLYENSDQQLWTQPVNLEMKENNLAEMTLVKQTPAERKNCKLICGPRVKPDKGILVRALDYLIS